MLGKGLVGVARHLTSEWVAVLVQRLLDQEYFPWCGLLNTLHEITC